MRKRLLAELEYGSLPHKPRKAPRKSAYRMEKYIATGPPAGLERKHSPDPSGEVAGISAFVVREVCERALDQRNRVGFVQQGAARESAYQEPSVRAEHLRTRTGLEETGYSEILSKEECPLAVTRSFFVDSNAEEFPPGYEDGDADDEMEDLVSSVHHESRNRREDFEPSFRTMGTMLENLGWD